MYRSGRGVCRAEKENYERIQKKRNEIYQLMMATRRDNKDKEGSGDDSITKAMADMFATDFVVEERPEEYIDV